MLLVVSVEGLLLRKTVNKIVFYKHSVLSLTGTWQAHTIYVQNDDCNVLFSLTVENI